MAASVPCAAERCGLGPKAVSAGRLLRTPLVPVGAGTWTQFRQALLHTGPLGSGVDAWGTRQSLVMAVTAERTRRTHTCGLWEEPETVCGEAVFCLSVPAQSEWAGELCVRRNVCKYL